MPSPANMEDVLAETCYQAHLSVQIEAGNDLTTDHSHTRPADLLVGHGASSREAAFGISVTSPLNTLTLMEAGVWVACAALAAEERKHVANDTKCHELRPLVTESYGAWGSTEAVEAFSQLASRLVTLSCRPKSSVFNDIYCRLNVSTPGESQCHSHPHQMHPVLMFCVLM